MRDSFSGAGHVYQETREYNVLNQMTRVTAVDEAASSTVMDMEYRFSATANNDKITSQMDSVSGEEVTYAYDSLQRPITATTTGPQ